MLSEEKKTQIYKDYAGKVKGYFYTQTSNAYLAEDLCADVFLKVYEKIDDFDEKKAAVSTWIYTIARNTLIDYFRTRKVYEEVPEDYTDDSTVEDAVLNNEAMEKLASALEKLDERERDIIIYKYYCKDTLKDIAEKLRISYAYVKILHNKALVELKKELNGLAITDI